MKYAFVHWTFLSNNKELYCLINIAMVMSIILNTDISDVDHICTYILGAAIIAVITNFAQDMTKWLKERGGHRI